MASTTVPDQRFLFRIKPTEIDGITVNDWTIGFWFKLDLGAIRFVPVFMYSLFNIGFDQHSLSMSITGALVWVVDDINFLVFAGPPALDDGEWHFVALRHVPNVVPDPPEPGQLSYSIDGAAFAGTIAAFAGPDTATDTWYYGGRPGVGNIWPGWLDDFVGWNFALSDADIAEYYNNGVPRNPDTISAIMNDEVSTPPAGEENRRCCMWIPMGLHDGTFVSASPNVTNIKETPFGVLSFTKTGATIIDSTDVPS